MKYYVVAKNIEGVEYYSAAVEYKILGIFTKREKKGIIASHGVEFNRFGDVWWKDRNIVEKAIEKDRIKHCGEEYWREDDNLRT